MSDEEYLQRRINTLVRMLFRLRAEDHRDHRHCLVSDCVVKQVDALLEAETKIPDSQK